MQACYIGLSFSCISRECKPVIIIGLKSLCISRECVALVLAVWFVADVCACLMWLHVAGTQGTQVSGKRSLCRVYSGATGHWFTRDEKCCCEFVIQVLVLTKLVWIFLNSSGRKIAYMGLINVLIVINVIQVLVLTKLVWIFFKQVMA